MVKLIWTLFAAMVIACTFQSLMVWTHQAADMAPYDVGTNVREPHPTAADSPKRGDSAIPEIRIVDEKDRKPTGFATQISDSASENAERAEFPSSF